LHSKRFDKNTVKHEIGHTYGMRHITEGFNPDNIMGDGGKVHFTDREIRLIFEYERALNSLIRQDKGGSDFYFAFGGPKLVKSGFIQTSYSWPVKPITGKSNDPAVTYLRKGYMAQEWFNPQLLSYQHNNKQATTILGTRMK